MYNNHLLNVYNNVLNVLNYNNYLLTFYAIY